MTPADHAGHAVSVACPGTHEEDRYTDAAFVVEADGALQVWRVDGTHVTVYAPGAWRRVTATGSGLGPDQ
jgi:hypothetical protein